VKGRALLLSLRRAWRPLRSSFDVKAMQAFCYSETPWAAWTSHGSSGWWVGSSTGVAVAGPHGRSVRVPKPEHLAAMKVAAMASDPSRTLQDLADIQFLLRVPGVDREEIRGYFVRYGLEKRFDELLASL